jgi:hypothetical protein
MLAGQLGWRTDIVLLPRNAAVLFCAQRAIAFLDTTSHFLPVGYRADTVNLCAFRRVVSPAVDSAMGSGPNSAHAKRQLRVGIRASHVPAVDRARRPRHGHCKLLEQRRLIGSRRQQLLGRLHLHTAVAVAAARVEQQRTAEQQRTVARRAPVAHPALVAQQAQVAARPREEAPTPGERPPPAEPQAAAARRARPRAARRTRAAAPRTPAPQTGARPEARAVPQPAAAALAGPARLSTVARAARPRLG